MPRQADSGMDPETMRSLSRQIYGHEIWIGDVFREGDTINAYGLYGHKMVPDKPMPTDYANVILYDDSGRTEAPDREIVREPHGWLFSFEDRGADVYTLYVDSNSTWVTDEAGWHRGVKRDFSGASFSGSYNMVAKRIISRDGRDPGNVIHSCLELMPETAGLKVGTDVRIRVLYEGEPLPRARIVAYAAGDQDAEMLRADDEGCLVYPVRKAVPHMFIAKHTDEGKSSSDEFDETSFTTTLTMEAVE